MLKVIGADNKAKVSSFIIAMTVVFGILMLALFYNYESPKFDDIHDSYCATIYYSSKTGFRTEYWGQRKDLQHVDHGTARACYRDNSKSIGISHFEVETSSTQDDIIQAMGAGLLEGSLTWMNIYNQWHNTVYSFCEMDDEHQTFCSWLRDEASANYVNIKNKAQIKGRLEHYWYQVSLFYYQLEGLEIGFKEGVKRARKDFIIESVDFVLLNMRADLPDLMVYYNEFVNKESQLEVSPQNKAKIVLKILEQSGKKKVLFGHSSDGDYSSMLKMVKKYHLRFHYAAGFKSSIVPNSNIIFSSYPGAISSTDDFYSLNGKHTNLLVSGVGIFYQNAELWKNIDLETSVFLGARIMAANRLAHSGKSWSKILSKEESTTGTGTKQWLIVDLNRMNNFTKSPVTRQENVNSLKSDEKIVVGEQMLNESFIWLVEQLPGRLHAEDVTLDFDILDYWMLDGHVYFEELHTISSAPVQNPVRFGNITNLSDLESVLRSQAYRGDLEEEKIPFGNFDLKLFSSENSEIQILNGPVTASKNESNIVKPVFNWKTSKLRKSQHYGQPNKFDFKFVKIFWAWK